MKSLIQIAGVIDQTEAEMLIENGVDYLGFPLRLPVNQEDLSEEEAIDIIANFPPSVNAVLITYLDKAEEIAQFCRYLGANHVQLHGDISVEELSMLRCNYPELVVFKSLVTGKNSLEELRKTVSSLEPFVDAFITDTFDPETGASGATGKTHDWSISFELREFSAKPLILAGGLNPENVYDSIMAVKPAGVDCHTGVEAEDGRKDPEKVLKFVKEAKRAFAELDI